MILNSIDIKQYLKFGGLKITPDLLENQYQQNGIDLILEKTEKLVLGYAGFTLGVTREFLELPNDLMAFVQIRSSWARMGFMLPPTVVDAGFKGTLTLEIVKFGESIELPIRERFVHLIFAKLSNPSEPYNGKYQNQVDITHAR
jgi:dCTP deaminase